MEHHHQEQRPYSERTEGCHGGQEGGNGDPAGPLCTLTSSSGGGDGGSSREGEAKIVLTSYSGLIFVIVTCSFCIPLFIAGIVMTAASLRSEAVTLYRTGVSLLAVSVLVALSGIVLVILVCTGVCCKKSTEASGAHHLGAGRQQNNSGIPMGNPLFSRFRLSQRSSSSSSSALNESAVLCLPPPYTSFPASESMTRDDSAISVPFRHPHEAWPATDANDPGLHLPPYSLHSMMSSFGGPPVSGPVVAWEEGDHKDDTPPTYEESCRDTTVIHM